MDIRVEYSGTACVFLALLCLVLPLDWLLAALTAAVFHELCHVIAVIFTGGNIYSLRIDTNGAVMEASMMEPWQELVCILAGPAGSLSLLALSKYIPKTALCGLVQGLFNLIPVSPLDGGRALKCMTGMLFSSKTANRICNGVKWAVLFLIAAAGICGTFAMKLGIMPALTAVFFLSRAMTGKIPCKEGKVGVQ